MNNEGGDHYTTDKGIWHGTESMYVGVACDLDWTSAHLWSTAPLHLQARGLRRYTNAAKPLPLAAEKKDESYS